jgi:hypothetical protein
MVVDIIKLYKLSRCRMVLIAVVFFLSSNFWGAPCFHLLDVEVQFLVL